MLKSILNQNVIISKCILFSVLECVHCILYCNVDKYENYGQEAKTLNSGGCGVLFMACRALFC